jgi:uncharacterized repeat protein (TIGR01451 family)
LPTPLPRPRACLPVLAALCLVAVSMVQVSSVLPAAAAASGEIDTVAGNGTFGYGGDGGPASASVVQSPANVRADGVGNLYFSDGSSRVRKIDPFGIITTVAGNGTYGFSGDGGPATEAELDGGPLALDGHGNLYIGDGQNFRVRRVDPEGIITTVAGTGGFGSYTGDGGLATAASLSGVDGLAVDAAGNLYISDRATARIRRIDAATGVIAWFAGNGLSAPNDGGPAKQAALRGPQGLAIAGNSLFVAQFTGDVRKIDLGTGIISTVAGTYNSNGVNVQPTLGDGGPATSAGFGQPVDVDVDVDGNLYIADGRCFEICDNAIRKVDTSEIITTVAGSPAFGYGGDGGPATSALLAQPNGVAALGNGAFAIADSQNNRIRVVTGNPDLLSLAVVSPLQVAGGSAFSYRLAVRNDGSAGAATGVVVSDPLPAGATYGGVTASQGSCGFSGSTVTCNLGPLAGGAAATVTISATAPSSSTSLVDHASVSADQADPYPANDTASSTTFVNAADLAVSLIASPNPGADVGQPLAYTATVTNRGPVGATGATLRDTLPAGLSLASASSSQGNCSHANAAVTCALGSLGAEATATVTVSVVPTAAGPTLNSVTVAADQVDPDAINNTAAVSEIVSAAGCGQVITKSTTLKSDIGPCGGDGVVIGANNIRLNLAGHRIFGMGNGPGTATLDDLAGIRLQVRAGVTIVGGTVSGFDTGIFLDSGYGNTVTRMTVRDNIGLDSSSGPFPDFGDGILIQHSSYNTITSNQVLHNGTFDGVGLFGVDTNGNLIQGNTIAGTVTNNAHVDGEGIIVNSFLTPNDPRRGESISHNDFLNNTITGNAAAGISNISNDSARIENNVVSSNGLLAFPNNGIGDQVGRVATTKVLDTVSGNQVTGNGGSGIQILRPLNGDTVTGNVADGNNADNVGAFNYEDTNGSCTANAWSNNTSLHGTASPACILAAPAPPPGKGPKANAPASDPASGSPSGAAPDTSAPPLPQANRPIFPELRP